MNTIKSATAVSLLAGLAACSNGAAGPPAVTAVNVQSYSKLQFAVGTANIGGQTGLNTVVTLRQPNGLSAVGYSTPLITWDGAFTNTSATGTNVDAGTKQISGSALPAQLGSAVPASTFGSGSNSYGAFGYGFNNANAGVGNANTSLRYPCLPLYGATIAAANLSNGSSNCATGTQTVGGPPAFPQLLGAPLAGELGSYLGFVPFSGLAPAPNPATGNSKFNLQVTIPAASGNIVLNAPPATMTNFAPLPAFNTPTFQSDGKGGGFITYSLPAGVTEAYLEIVNYGPDGMGGANCNFGPPPFFYTVKVGPGSPTTIGLGGTANDPGDNLAPTPSAGKLNAMQSTHTFCTKADNTTATAAAAAAPDQYQVFAVGFDYPAFEAAYPQSNNNPAPTIVGANGQADLTMSDLSVATPTL